MLNRSDTEGIVGRRPSRVIGLLLVLALVVAGCIAGESTEESATSSTVGGSSTTADSGASATTATGEDGPSGDTLTARVASDIVDYDPLRHTGTELPWQPQVYEPLLRYDENLDVVPVLAESYEVADDFGSITLTLRSGVRFHNGEPLTATVIADYFNLARDPEIGGQAAASLGPVEEVQIVDDSHVRFVFSQSQSEESMTDILVEVLVGWPDNQPNVADTAIGTGPFLQGPREPGQSFTLLRNEDYWGKAPHLATLEFKVISDGGAAVAALRSGEVDAAYDLPFSSQAELASDFPLVLNPASPGTLVVGLNAKFPPFDREEVRQAFLLAMDREAMVQSVYFGESQAKVLPWPEVSSAFDAQLAEEWSYDIDRAREMFADAGVTVLEDPILAPAELTQMTAVAQIIQATLAEAGVEARVETPDLAGFLDVLLAGESAIAVFGVGSENLRFPPTFMNLPFTNTTGNLLWPDGTPPDYYVDAVDTARVAVTPEEQAAAFAVLNDAYMQSASLIPLVRNPLLFNASQRVNGVIQDTYSAWFLLGEAFIED